MGGCYAAGNELLWILSNRIIVFNGISQETV